MTIKTTELTDRQLQDVLSYKEGHFMDLKAKEIKPSKLTKAISAFANAAMETFDQGRPQLGCMSCHNQARMAVDFVWSVLDHAYPAKFAPASN